MNHPYPSVRMPSRMPSRRVVPAVVLLALAALLPLAACGSRAIAASAPTTAVLPPIGQVAIQAEDFSFDMPSTVPAGPVEFTFINQSSDDVHQAQFFHLKPGVTPQQFIAALKSGGPASTRTLAAPWGGIDEVVPHTPVHVIEVMAPGTYVVACLVRGPDGMPHYAMGMVTTFVVPAASGTPPPYAPADDGTVTLVEMRILLPAAIQHPGAHIFKIVNAGTLVHAFDILRLAPGTTAQDVEAYLNAPSGPPPFVLLGGVGGTLPGGTQWLLTALRPGNYVAACLVVDPATGKPHAAMGMLAPFTVAA